MRALPPPHFVKPQALSKASRDQIIFDTILAAVATFAVGIATITGCLWVASPRTRKAEYEVKLKDFMAWLDHNSRSLRDMISRSKIREILGVKKMN